MNVKGFSEVYFKDKLESWSLEAVFIYSNCDIIIVKILLKNKDKKNVSQGCNHRSEGLKVKKNHKISPYDKSDISF